MPLNLYLYFKYFQFSKYVTINTIGIYGKYKSIIRWIQLEYIFVEHHFFCKTDLSNSL